MPVNPYRIVVKVEAPPRGTTEQPMHQFSPSECVCTWSWGLQPATALIDWVSAQEQAAIVPNAALTIEVAGGLENGGHTFYGICKSLVPVLASNGISQMQEFVDSREFLMWDVAYCAFNRRVDRIVDGVFTKFYAHILPEDFNTYRETYTTSPYTARQILDFLFDAPTTETPWSRVYHPFLDNPVYGLDFTNGRKLGQAVMEISERLGLTFTLLGGRYRLVWALKGVGTLPNFPANADGRRGPGFALSGNPTRVRILGDRNLYQVLNVDMVADWVSGWQAFYDFNAFVRDIFLYESTEADFGSIAAGTRYNAIDPELKNNAGYLLARARAQTITVAEYADLRDARDGGGGAFRDYRKFQNRSRLSMPAVLYLSQVLFRAFRFPSNFTLRNRYGELLGLTSLELADEAVVQVTHDPITGDMFYETIVPSQPNGYAIVQGYQVAADAFRTLTPEHFNIDQWIDGQAVWQAAPFQIDNSGEGDQFLLFDSPIINSEDLIDASSQAYPVLNAAATVTVPAVRVAVTFRAERFSYVEGYGTKDDVENVAGLSGVHVGYSGFSPVEIFYADGQTATQKAAAIAATLLNRQFYFAYGGYVVQGCNGTQLTPMLDRVTVTLNAGGLTEEVDFTSERARNVTQVGGTAYLQMQPDRDFNRVAQLQPLLAGQAELRESGNQLRAEAGFLLKHPRISRTLVDTFHLLMGLDAAPNVVTFPLGSTGTLSAGTPVFRAADKQAPTLPRTVSPSVVTNPVFEGVTIAHGEAANGPVRLTRTGNGGVVFARVKGPVAVGDAVGYKTGAYDYLSSDPVTAVATCREPITGSTVQLIRVQTSAPGGGTDAVKMFKVQTISDDYLVCKEWDGTTLGTDNINVAKWPRNRKSLASETIDGVTFTYTYTSQNQRTSKDNSTPQNSQTEILYQRFVANEVIWAAQSANGVGFSVSGTPVTWVEMRERIWLRKYVQ